MTRYVALLWLVAACTACGDDGSTVQDAAVDTIPDPCAPEMTFTGEYVDWDSTTTAFKGIFGAKFTHRTDTTKTSSTAPNGRFLMCIPAADAMVDVAPMAGSDYIAGAVVVNKAVVTSGAMLSYRSFTTTRAQAFGFLPALAHVYVHVEGGIRTIGTAAPAQVKKTLSGAAWTDGDAGTDVYLGNIDPAGGTTLLTVTGGNAIGAGSIPLTAGAFTYVTVVAR